MSDESTAAAEAEERQGVDEGQEQGPDDDAPETGGDQQFGRLPDDHPVVKALNKANKEAEQARLKVKEYEDRDKTEQEKVAEKAAEAEKRAAEAEAKALRYEVATEKGVPKRAMKFLTGTTQEELEEQADEILALIGDADGGEKPSRRPKERLKSGAASDSEPEPDTKKLADSILSEGRI